MATQTISISNFREVIRDNRFVVIDFTASWCGPCKSFGPIVEEVSEKRKNVFFGKCDVDRETDVSREFGIRSVPTTVLFLDGVKVSQKSGYMSAQEFDKLVSMLFVSMKEA